MTNEEIEKRLHFLVPRERRITAEILQLISLAECRKIPLARGYSGTFDWLVSEFKFSQAAAYRRIQSARLLREIPDLGRKLETGSLNLSLVVQAQVAFRKEERRTGRKVNVQDKAELLGRIENKTAEAAQKIIKERFPEVNHRKESLRRLNDTESRLNTIIDNDCRRHLKRSKELLSHVLPEATWGEIVGFGMKYFVEERDPLLTHPVTATVNHRVITPALRAKVLQRAGGRCEFVSPETNQRCESRHQLEVDHIEPKALGGSNRLENLRALCRPHNQYEAERILGPLGLNARPASAPPGSARHCGEPAPPPRSRSPSA